VIALGYLRRMIDTYAIRLRWKADGSKRDERGKRLFAASEARAAGRRRCWERPATFRVQSTPAVRPRGRSTDTLKMVC
jgi:hypothetical protein